jgi:hypothetical protein
VGLDVFYSLLELETDSYKPLMIAFAPYKRAYIQPLFNERGALHKLLVSLSFFDALLEKRLSALRLEASHSNKKRVLSQLCAFKEK